jgi:hypothetical protein
MMTSVWTSCFLFEFWIPLNLGFVGTCLRVLLPLIDMGCHNCGLLLHRPLNPTPSPSIQIPTAGGVTRSLIAWLVAGDTCSMLGRLVNTTTHSSYLWWLMRLHMRLVMQEQIWFMHWVRRRTNDFHALLFGSQDGLEKLQANRVHLDLWCFSLQMYIRYMISPLQMPHAT